MHEQMPHERGCLPGVVLRAAVHAATRRTKPDTSRGAFDPFA